LDASALLIGMEGRGRETLIDVLDARVRVREAVRSSDRTSPSADTNRPAKNSVEVPPKKGGLGKTNCPARYSSEFLATNFPAKNSREFTLWESGADTKPPAKYSMDTIRLVVTTCLDEGLLGIPILEISLPAGASVGSLWWPSLIGTNVPATNSRDP
jgi:hypothetical protein